MPEDRLEIGQITAIHALKGEVRVQYWCDSPEFFARFKTMYLDKNGETPVKVSSVRPSKNILIVKIKGIDTPEDAQKLVGKELYIDKKDVRLKKGTYFIADLIGLTVVDADDEALVYGTLTDVSQTGANDVYHVTFPDGKTRYVPAIPSVVIQTDIEGKTMRIRPLKGLFDDE